ncbi:MAG: hypothetical protein R3C44_14800 [Chloroflexota bacterium]
MFIPSVLILGFVIVLIMAAVAPTTSGQESTGKVFLPLQTKPPTFEAVPWVAASTK